MLGRSRFRTGLARSRAVYGPGVGEEIISSIRLWSSVLPALSVPLTCHAEISQHTQSGWCLAGGFREIHSCAVGSKCHLNTGSKTHSSALGKFYNTLI